MPELPEVETMVRFLRPELTGRAIVSARLFWLRTLAAPGAAEFYNRMAGEQIQSVTRRAKYIHLALGQGHFFIHLRMSGDLLLKPRPYSPAKHDRLTLDLSDGRTLVFNDTRKFGRAWLVDNPEQVIGGLGPEPLDPSFTPGVLHRALLERHRQIKPLLLDQSFVAGLGNIYTDEALHLSGLHPMRLSDTISLPETQRLHRSICSVLAAGIEHNGASIDWVYRGGGFQNYFRVYGREGQSCLTCGTKIEKIVIGQRGTHFCPVCQPR
jgi:formamidopyrimidine-DNA glycosylase